MSTMCAYLPTCMAANFTPVFIKLLVNLFLCLKNIWVIGKLFPTYTWGLAFVCIKICSVSAAWLDKPFPHCAQMNGFEPRKIKEPCLEYENVCYIR